jgi:hypothetical protein
MDPGGRSLENSASGTQPYANLNYSYTEESFDAFASYSTVSSGYNAEDSSSSGSSYSSYTDSSYNDGQFPENDELEGVDTCVKTLSN